MAGGYISRIKTWIAGEILYAADLNTEFDNTINLQIPDPAGVAHGDVLVRGASQWQRLAAGTAKQTLASGGAGALPSFANCAYAVLTTRGDLLFMGASALTRLAAGTYGQELKTKGAVADPIWTNGLLATMIAQGDLIFAGVDWQLASKTDISFTAATKIINSVAGDFSISDLEVGRKFTVVGSSNNDGTYTVAAITADDITVSETLVDEVAGASVTITVVKPARLAPSTDGYVLKSQGAGANPAFVDPLDLFNIQQGWKDWAVNKAVVDSDGKPNFISIGTGLAVNLDGTPTNIECLIDSLYCKIASDTSISSLAANSTCYLWFEKPSSGETIDTMGHSLLRPHFAHETPDWDINQTSKDAWILLRYNVNYNAVAQGITTDVFMRMVQNVKLFLKQDGTISSGDVWVEIHPDSGGQPSGTPITNGTSNTIAASTIAADPGEEKTFTFSTAPELDPDTKYYLVVAGDFAVSTTNYLQVALYQNDVYVGGHTHQLNGSTWQDYYTTYDLYFKLDVNPKTDQHWLDISTMQMKRWTGSAWENKDRIFVGEAVTDGSSVTSVINYALARRYTEQDIIIAASTDYEKSHNLAIPTRLINFLLTSYETDRDKAKPIVIDVGGTNGIYYKSPTDDYNKVKIRTATNPIRKDDDSGWTTAGYLNLVAEAIF